MKQLKMMFYFSVALLVIVGCSENTNETSTNHEIENNSIVESLEENTNEADEPISKNESGSEDSETVDNDSNHTAAENSESAESDLKNDGVLSEYSSEQIEYARIWLQLGPNQELDKLYVHHIPAGEPLHPKDETSVSYPEDVIQLSGTRLVDGSVTYSGNGDGTINVYNVPLRWDGLYPAGEEFYQEIIDNTELVPVDTGDDQEIIALIKLLND